MQGAHPRRERNKKFWLENLKERDHMEKMLTCTLKKNQPIDLPCVTPWRKRV
jgi:hypothetical protein